MWTIIFVTFNIIMLSISLLRAKFDFAYPPILYFGTWTVASLGYLLMQSYWGTGFSIKTFLIMTVGDLLFWGGCELTSWSKTLVTIKGKGKIRFKQIGIMHLHIFLVFELISLRYIYNHQLRLARAVYGNVSATNITELLMYARTATIHSNYSNSRLFVNLLRIVYVLSLVLFFDYLKNKRGRADKKLIGRYELFQCALCPVITVFSASRNILLGIVSGYLVIFFCLRRRQAGALSFKQEIKIIKKLVLIAALFILAFAGLNVLLGRTENNSFTSVLSYTMKYVASAIPALDYFANNPFVDKVSHFGETTFNSIYVTLYSVGLTNYKVQYAVHEFTPVFDHGFSTNIYTIYYPYLKDFGVIGLAMSMINGIIYGLFYRYSKTRSTTSILVYAVMSFPLVFSFFEEKVWTIFNTNIVEIVIAVILSYMFLQNKTEEATHAISYRSYYKRNH